MASTLIFNILTYFIFWLLEGTFFSHRYAKADLFHHFLKSRNQLVCFLILHYCFTFPPVLNKKTVQYLFQSQANIIWVGAVTIMTLCCPLSAFDHSVCQIDHWHISWFQKIMLLMYFLLAISGNIKLNNVCNLILW